MILMITTFTPKPKVKKSDHPFKDKKSFPYTLPDFTPELLIRVRLYAASKRIPIYRAFEHLIAIGLKAVKENPAQYDVRIYNPEEPQKPQPPPTRT